MTDDYQILTSGPTNHPQRTPTEPNDERGMTSHKDAAWCSQRFNDDQPFGGMPVVCCRWPNR